MRAIAVFVADRRWVARLGIWVRTKFSWFQICFIQPHWHPFLALMHTAIGIYRQGKDLVKAERFRAASCADHAPGPAKGCESRCAACV
jgi:hypothetical protein